MRARWADGDVPHAKPDPRAVLPALRWLRRRGIAPEEVVAIGDHPGDERIASAYGLSFVAVLTGSSRAGEFRGGPTRRWEAVERLDQLLDRDWLAPAPASASPGARSAAGAADLEPYPPAVG